MWLWGGIFDIANKEIRLKELLASANDEKLWSDQERAKLLLKERSELQREVERYEQLNKLIKDAKTCFELALESHDSDLEKESIELIANLNKLVSEQEFLCKMSEPFDSHSAILEINSGSGGTEAQDWAEMLLRMYLRWAERKGYKLEELDYQSGEGAGIKSATFFVDGAYAYGYLRSEHGVHRLVRISPFDSNARRHTSFASVTITPDIEEEIEIKINENDLRIDTYRASGAGGQHVNKTDSAVRITHMPTGIVVCCQNERSQHKNKHRAMQILRAKLYELEQRQQGEKIKQATGAKMAIDFGNQIRSYVMQPYQMVKDLRTDFETSNVQGVLDGEIDQFIESYLLGAKK